MPTTLQTLQELTTEVETATTLFLDQLRDAWEDADKFDRGNSAAGTRVRKKVLAARKLVSPLRRKLAAADAKLHDVRGSIQEIRIARKG